MTYTTKLLALALEINPNVVWAIEDETVFDLYGGEEFDPANNIEQAWAVLAWALVNGVNIRSDNVFWYPTPESCRFERIDHDGTAAGLRKAVTEAGMRVVS